MRHKILTAIRYAVLYAFLIFVVLLVLYPLAFTVSSAFSKSDGLATLSAYPFQEQFSLRQFRRLFSETKYVEWFKNTLKIAAVNMTLSVCVTTVSAYIFSRFRFGMKKPMLMSMLILQDVPLLRRDDRPLCARLATWIAGQPFRAHTDLRVGHNPL